MPFCKLVRSSLSERTQSSGSRPYDMLACRMTWSHPNAPTDPTDLLESVGRVGGCIEHMFYVLCYKLIWVGVYVLKADK